MAQSVCVIVQLRQCYPHRTTRPSMALMSLPIAASHLHLGSYTVFQPLEQLVSVSMPLAILVLEYRRVLFLSFKHIVFLLPNLYCIGFHLVSLRSLVAQASTYKRYFIDA